MHSSYTETIAEVGCTEIIGKVNCQSPTYNLVAECSVNKFISNS